MVRRTWDFRYPAGFAARFANFNMTSTHGLQREVGRAACTDRNAPYLGATHFRIFKALERRRRKQSFRIFGTGTTLWRRPFQIPSGGATTLGLLSGYLCVYTKFSCTWVRHPPHPCIKSLFYFHIFSDFLMF